MKYFSFLILMLLGSCKSYFSLEKKLQPTQQKITLGAMGEEREHFFQKKHNHTAWPSYQNPLKIEVDIMTFDSTSYKAFKKAQRLQNNAFEVDFIDTLEVKPKYFKFKIADRIGVINSLQHKDNVMLMNYLKNKKETHVITSVSVAFDTNTTELIHTADEVYLERIGIHDFVLNTYQNNNLHQTIRFNDGVVFGYQTSFVCWKENSNRKLEIIDLIEKDDKCPNLSYRSAERAKKHINYYKF